MLGVVVALWLFAAMFTFGVAVAVAVAVALLFMTCLCACVVLSLFVAFLDAVLLCKSNVQDDIRKYLFWDPAGSQKCTY